VPQAALPPPGVPDDLPVRRRSAVRLVVLDSLHRVLLFHTRDSFYPGQGHWWELPGGGIDAGESYLEAAVRELREETGILVATPQIGPPCWRRTASFRYRGTRHVQDEVVVAVRLPGAGPDVDESLRLENEREDYFGFRWWPVAEITAARPDSGAERFYPGQLPALLGPFLAGEEIDEPFELCS